MSRVHTMTDSVKEVAVWAVGATLVGSAVFSIFEHTSLFESLYWSVVSGSSTGYGDYTPKTTGGRITTILYLIFMVWVIGPLFQGRITAYMTVNNDAFDDQEQEELKSGLRQALQELAELKALLTKDPA